MKTHSVTFSGLLNENTLRDVCCFITKRKIVCLGVSDIFARIADEIDTQDSQKNPHQQTLTLLSVILMGSGKSFYRKIYW